MRGECRAVEHVGVEQEFAQPMRMTVKEPGVDLHGGASKPEWSTRSSRHGARSGHQGDLQGRDGTLSASNGDPTVVPPTLPRGPQTWVHQPNRRAATLPRSVGASQTHEGHEAGSGLDDDDTGARVRASGSLPSFLLPPSVSSSVRLHSLLPLRLPAPNSRLDPSDLSSLGGARRRRMEGPPVALFDSLKAAKPFFLLAGPNVIESEEHVLKMAKHIKGITTKLGIPLVFKSSFDKANRTSSKSFRGPGLEEGLKCEAVGRVADIIQIPAFLCRQTDLLVAAAKTGKIINIKKGQFCAPSVMVNSAEKIRLAGNPNVMVYDLIVDPRNLEWLREANCPVVADITHALQQPAGRKLDGGGVASGGFRELIPCISRTSVAVGVDGIFMEVHDDPLKAPCDGPTQWV
ncbi:hypothetical protein C2845_PM06G12950 [Panicum miliaceum]|uniref:3-deoxy-8-phosphooctulonate synthase n=1 Tax=Panicum miliaceum TaxID=4540 RepID=A0A3L6R4D9_PANMI|nr:hypothetical protein C2845_PM06G12950 [Panicum miliaceum]